MTRACITYDASMRTTVDLPPAVHRRARDFAERTGRSLSSVVADMTARGLDQVDEPPRIGRSPLSGFPTVDLGLGRTITNEEVLAFLDEDE